MASLPAPAQTPTARSGLAPMFSHTTTGQSLYERAPACCQSSLLHRGAREVAVPSRVTASKRQLRCTHGGAASPVVRCRTRKCSQTWTGHGARCYQSLPCTHHELRPCQYHIRRAQLSRHIYGICVDRHLVPKILNPGAILFCVSSALLCLLCHVCSILPALFCSTLVCPTLFHVHICEPRVVCTCFHVSNCVCRIYPRFVLRS
jgi:hypothetical protein